MPLAVSAELRELPLRQAGVVSRQQALSLGLDPAAVNNQLKSKRWQQVQRGVYGPSPALPAGMPGSGQRYSGREAERP